MESRWWRDFPYPSRPALVPNQPPIQWVNLVSSLGVKRPVRGANHPLTSIAEVKERIELYVYSSLGLYGQLQDEFCFTFTGEKKGSSKNYFFGKKRRL
jgi:hypothetical protein